MSEQIHLRAVRALLAAALLALCLSAPAAAATESLNGGSFSELSRQAQEPNTETTTRATTSETTSEPRNNSKTLLIIAGAAVLLLSGIGLVITRDARRVAPAVDGELADRRPAADRAARHRKRRAKARAARQQRKRNR